MLFFLKKKFDGSTYSTIINTTNWFVEYNK